MTQKKKSSVIIYKKTLWIFSRIFIFFTCFSIQFPELERNASQLQNVLADFSFDFVLYATNCSILEFSIFNSANDNISISDILISIDESTGCDVMKTCVGDSENTTIFPSSREEVDQICESEMKKMIESWLYVILTLYIYIYWFTQILHRIVSMYRRMEWNLFEWVTKVYSDETNWKCG